MRVLRIVAAMVALAALAFGCWLVGLDERELHACAERWFGYAVAPDYPDQLSSPTRARILFSLAPCFLFALATAVSARLAAAFHHVFTDSMAILMETGRRAWSGMGGWERWWFMASVGACTALRCAWAMKDPPMLDEAISWLFFAERGPLVALSFYAAPNNHMAYSGIAALTGTLPVDPLLALRAPTLLASILVQCALYLIMRRFAGSFAAILGVAFAMAAPLTLQFGHLGRGYMLIVLAATLAIGACAHWLRHADRRALHLLCLTCIAGASVMPSFLYAIAALFVGLAALSAKRLQIARTAVNVLLGLAALYAPGVIISGIEAFTANRWVEPWQREELIAGWMPHFTRVGEGILGVAHALPAMLVATCAAVALARKQERPLAWLMALTVLLAMLTPLIHGVLPFERTWIYLVIPMAIMICIVLNRLPIADRWSWCALPLVVAGFSVQVVRLRSKLPEMEVEAFQAARGSAVLKAAEPDAILLGAQPLSTYLLFEIKRGSVEVPWTFNQGQIQGMAGARVGLVARDGSLVPGAADRLLFRDSTGQSIWLRGPAIHE